ncbi:hypothetical protein TIFTF001_029300 [Ficus carica]|uniref:Transposase MuDR plant domain-containing protein n=1 Tax=Ficus carica TaxID=3494 RepID=A0AA88DVQ9_FICCA|nr:hypothetical protein TIFTF001_029300 [Ficus carica]
MHLIASRGNFEFKVDKYNVDFYVLSCIVDGCTWMVRASRISGRDIWVVRKYVSQHTCPRDVVSNEHHQASSQFVSELLKADFSLGINERARPRDAMALMCGKHGVEISYHGLCSYELDSQGRILYFFLSLATSLDGWRHYRPAISVDAKAYQPEDFEYFMRKMESVRPEIRQYLYEVGWFNEHRNQADKTSRHFTTGRPRMEMIPAVGEVHTQLRCSKCNNFGHNKHTCKNRVSSTMGSSSSKKMKSCR